MATFRYVALCDTTSETFQKYFRNRYRTIWLSTDIDTPMERAAQTWYRSIAELMGDAIYESLTANEPAAAGLPF